MDNINYHMINDKVYDSDTGFLIKNKFVRTIDGVFYSDKNGNIVKNVWILDANKEYSYMDNNGKMVVDSFKIIDNKTYYFNKQGYMVKDKTISINDINYSFNKLGELI